MPVDIFDNLLKVYGNDNDPLWNAKVKPLLNAALLLAEQYASPQLDLFEVSKIFLAYPTLVTVATSKMEDKKPYEDLIHPKGVDVTFFRNGSFINYQTFASLKPLVELISSRLDVAPEKIWPAGFAKPQTEDANTKKFKESLFSHLKEFEPYAPVKDIVKLGVSSHGAVLLPVYSNSFVVFGSAQYFFGFDGGVLCATLSYSPQELEALYLEGERTFFPEHPTPDDSPESWARNCGPTARAVAELLDGITDAEAHGTLGHWVKGQFCEGETLDVMLGAVGLKDPPPFSDINVVPEIVSALGANRHLIVGVRWKGLLKGHWFNVRNNGANVEWVDGQTGRQGAWPPPFLDRVEKECLVLKPQQKKASSFWRF